MADSNEQQRKIRMKFSEESEAGVYSNAVSVHVNGNELVLDFAYSMPKIGGKDADQVIKVVSRVNMTHKTSESFLKILSNAILDWKNKEKEQNAANVQNASNNEVNL